MIDKERLAYALAIVGPVDMDDSNDAYIAYAEDIAEEYAECEFPNSEFPHTERWQFVNGQDKCPCGAEQPHEHRWVSYSLTGKETWDRCDCGAFRTEEPVIA